MSRYFALFQGLVIEGIAEIRQAEPMRARSGAMTCFAILPGRHRGFH
jgi:hypothetical protein